MQSSLPTSDQSTLLAEWRAIALERWPYMASLLLSLSPRNAPGLGTFAVDDAHRLYVDFDAVVGDGSQFCAEALMHECGHLWGEHKVLADEIEQARGEVDRRVMNIGADASINDDWRDAGCRRLAEIGVLPAKLGLPDYQTAQFYYDALRQRQQKNQGQQGQSQDDGDQGDQPGPGQQGQDEQDEGQGVGSGNGEPYRGCGSGAGGPQAPCELGDGDDNGNSPAITPAEKDVILIETASSIRNHVKMYGQGSIPGGLVERAEQILAPSKVPWRRVLAAMMRRAVRSRAGKTDSSYYRINRRQPSVKINASGDRVVNPGHFSPQPTIVVIRDTSGSMTPADLATVTNEVDGIARKVGVKGADLTVVDVDAAVHSKIRYKGARSIAQISGNGGTDMRIGIDEAVKMRPTLIVVITDGGTPWPATKPRIPVVACVVGPQTEQLAELTPDWMPTVTVDIDED